MVLALVCGHYWRIKDARIEKNKKMGIFVERKNEEISKNELNSEEMDWRLESLIDQYRL